MGFTQPSTVSFPLKELTSIVGPTGPNVKGVSFISSEDGNRSTFQNAMFSGYLEFPTMDTVQKPSDSVWYTSSSETFKSNRLLFEV
jgi:hypothetical protein